MNHLPPCWRIDKDKWDWKSGQHFVDSQLGTGNEINRSYFDCGIYMFDGTFNVVVFPKGMTIYHGSPILANFDLKYPTGKNSGFYDDSAMGGGSIPINMSQSDLLATAAASNNSVEYIVSKSFRIEPAWFGDPGTAKSYNAESQVPGFEQSARNCNGKCIYAFSLKEDSVFIILDDDFNIARIKENDGVTAQVKKHLNDMFNIGNQNLTHKQRERNYTNLNISLAELQKSTTLPPGTKKYATEFLTTEMNAINEGAHQKLKNKIKYSKNRMSNREWDLPFASWMCENVILPYKYAGFGASMQGSTHHVEFHQEFIFCNPTKYLERNYDSPLDWQHRDYSPANPEAKKYMKQLMLYKSTNVDFHAGNLIEHSIWSLLYSEHLIRENVFTLTKYKPSDENAMFRAIAFSAFIHDLGKMDPSDVNVKKNVQQKFFVFFAVPDHPSIGMDYISGKKQLPLFNQNLEPEGNLDIVKFFADMGVDYSKYNIFVGMIILYHKVFGDSVLKPYNELKSAADKNLFKQSKILDKGNDKYRNDLANDPVLPTAEKNNRFTEFSKSTASEKAKLNTSYNIHLITSLKPLVEDYVFEMARTYKAYGCNGGAFARFVYALLIVSISDINGNQPAGVGRLNDTNKVSTINKKSAFFPYLTNLSKVYRGNDLVKVSDINETGVEIAKKIIDYIESDGFQSHFFP